jgi:DNA-binding transcriptional MerR regulator
MQLDFLPNERPAAAIVIQPALTQPANMSIPMSHPEPALPSEKSAGAFKTISEAAAVLDVPQHVLRFWEARFAQVKPLKRSGGRRYYRPEDMDILATIKHMLYEQGYTIKGAKQAFSQHKHAPADAEAPEEGAVKIFSEQQKKQLAVMRLELIGMRAALKPFIA